MKNFLEPENIAIIGISRKTGPGSFNLLENLLDYQFKGKIFPVNPHAENILGIKTYPDISKIGCPIDLAIISLPRDLVLNSIKECIEANVKAVIIVSQGFADADAIGKEIQNKIERLSQKSGMRILGPNTLGVVNNFNNLTTSFMSLIKKKAPIGMICQSGVFFVGDQSFSGQIGKGIDIGNACDIGFYESVEYFAQDPEIKIIIIHMEGLEHGRPFIDLLSKVVTQKPVIILKTGQSATGAKAAASHSGTMAGDFQIYEAALKQSGVHFISKSSQMKDAARALLYMPPLKNNRIAVITVTGAGGIMASDALENNGLRLASYSPETIETLAELSPSWMPLGNPLDIWPAVMKHNLNKIYETALKAALMDDQVDGVLCISLAPMLPEYELLDVSESLNKVISQTKNKKPVAFWLYGPNTAEIKQRLEQKKQIMVYDAIEKAAWSFSILLRQSQKTNATVSHAQEKCC